MIKKTNYAKQESYPLFATSFQRILPFPTIVQMAAQLTPEGKTLFQTIQQITNPYELCDTLFFPGITTSQSQVLKYVGDQTIPATTGQMMWCTGRNHLLPINVIYKLSIGQEIPDVNLKTFSSYEAYFNPLKLISAAITMGADWYFGYHFSPPVSKEQGSIATHSMNISQISIGQEKDIEAHSQKYRHWHTTEDKTDGLILWGVSRGTAATFCALAQKKYPEVRLVVLEGAVDSISNVIPKLVENVIPVSNIARPITNAVNAGLTFLKKNNIMQYDPEGPSPLKSVAQFPEGVPVVFITSKADCIVPCENTTRIAKALAQKGKNDVYLLVLERSSHTCYMFDDPTDREKYETFIHAIYKKYRLKHDPDLAARGEPLVESCALHSIEAETLDICRI